MTSKSYQPRNDPPSTRVRCPVCHEAVYSRAGIHPQCAVRQSDPPKSKNKSPVASGEAEPVGPDPVVNAAVLDPDPDPTVLPPD